IKQHAKGTYAAPEADLTEESDVWSFGCVLLVVLIFNHEGVAGVNEFMASLLRETGIDGFYNPQTLERNAETSNGIGYLRKRSKTESDKLVTLKLLDLLEKQILVPARSRVLRKARADIGKVENAMKE